MLIVHVQIRVKPEFAEKFIGLTLENARQSRQEAGIARFDLLQDPEDANQFALVEVYRNPLAAVVHKETAHYAKWRDGVADMMAEPRIGRKFLNIDPPDSGW